MISREAIFEALFGLTDGLAWGAPPRSFLHRARRVKLWSDLPGQPALCQAEHDETITEVTGLPPKRVFGASWLIYHDAGKDPDAAPANETNQILDAIEALFPTGDPDHVQTLGGLVHHAFISGRVFKDSGDLDGQALIVVPIQMVGP